MSEEYEKYIAVREGAQNTASEDYFAPRASVDEKRFHTVFKAGFERAYDLRESELATLRSQVAELERRNSALRDFADELQRQLDEAARPGKPVGMFYVLPGGVYRQVPKGYKGTYHATALYAHPVNLPALIEQAKAEEAERIGKLIHYPECWDTACYQTLDDALSEIGCSECRNKS